MNEPTATCYAVYILRVLSRTEGLNIVSWPVESVSDELDRVTDFEIEAWSSDTGERWHVRAPSLYEAAEALADQVGISIG